MRFVCLGPVELKVRVSGEGFKPTGNDGSDITEIGDVWANASVALF
jgi:hypothetical protein